MNKEQEEMSRLHAMIYFLIQNLHLSKMASYTKDTPYANLEPGGIVSEENYKRGQNE